MNLQYKVLLLKNGGMIMSFEDKINQAKDSIKEGLEKLLEMKISNQKMQYQK